MSISAQNLLSSRAKKFAVSESSQDFQQMFVDAVNLAIEDINQATGLDTARISSTNDSIDIDESMFSGCLTMGIDYYIADYGQFTIQNLDGLDRKYKRKLALTHMNYAKSIDLSAKFGDLSA